MRILVAHNSYQQRGGEDFVFEHEVGLLRENGHEVFCVTEDNARIDGMGKLELAQTSLWNQKIFDTVSDIISRHKIDLVHIHNFFPLFSRSIFSAAHAKGAAIVHTSHNFRLMCLNGAFFRDSHSCHDCVNAGHFLPGVVHRCYRNNLPASAVAALSMKNAVGAINEMVDRVIVLSEHALSELERGGISRALIRTKNNFVPDRGVGKGDGNLVACLGRLTEEKGIATLLNAWRTESISVPLVIAGAGPFFQPAMEFSQVNPLVTVKSWLDDAAVHDLLRKARLLVVPSIADEPEIPIVAVQALSVGTPLILADSLKGGASVLGAGAAVEYPASDANALARLVQRLYCDDVLMQTMRGNARSLFLSRYSAQPNYDRLMEIYLEALQFRESRRAERAR